MSHTGPALHLPPHPATLHMPAHTRPRSRPLTVWARMLSHPMPKTRIILPPINGSSSPLHTCPCCYTAVMPWLWCLAVAGCVSRGLPAWKRSAQSDGFLRENSSIVEPSHVATTCIPHGAKHDVSDSVLVHCVAIYATQSAPSRW